MLGPDPNVGGMPILISDLSSAQPRLLGQSSLAIDQQTQRSWLLAIFFVAMGCLFSVLPIGNALIRAHDNKDYWHWHGIGQSVVAGEPLYTDVRNGEPEYMYPPTAAVLFYAPLSKFGTVPFVTILCVINCVSWVAAIWAASVLITGKSMGAVWRSALFAGLSVAPYVWDIQLLGQTNLMLLALTLLAFVGIRSQSPLLTGMLFGTAVSMKAFPVTAMAYFIVRRQWLAVIASVASIGALIWFLPGIVRGFERNTNELQQWAQLMIFDQSGQTMSGRSSIGFTRRNQSLVSCAHRLLRPVNAGDDPQKPLHVNLVSLTPHAAQLIGHGACVLLGFVLLVACRFRFGQTSESEGLEIAMVCTLVPLCSPLAWTYFFCWLLPAWLALAYWAVHPSLGRTDQRIVMAGAIVGGLFLISAVSEQFDPRLQAYGVTALGSVILFLTLAFARFRHPVALRVADRAAK